MKIGQRLKSKTRILTHVGPYAPWTRWSVMKASILRVQNKTKYEGILILSLFICMLSFISLVIQERPTQKEQNGIFGSFWCHNALSEQF